MPLSDLSPLSYFKELHVVPRTLFAIGGILFVGALGARNVALVLAGLGVVFAGLAWNLFLDCLTHDASPPYQLRLWWGGTFQAFACTAISLSSLYLGFYMYRHGSLPPMFLPIPKTH